MKKIASSVLYLMFLLAMACSGDDNDDPGPGPGTGGDGDSARDFENCRVILSTREGFADDVYQYDDQQRLTSQSGGSYLAEYEYNASQLTINTYHDGDLQTTLEVTLDGDGKPLQYIKTYTNIYEKTETKVYQYDAQGQLIKTTSTREGSTTEKHRVFQWLDGNMIAESEPDGTKMTKYTYASDKNQPVDWFGEIGIEYGLRAIRNKNRVRTITDPDGDVFTHSYSEDDNGRIISRTIQTPDKTYTEEFTLQCK